MHGLITCEVNDTISLCAPIDKIDWHLADDIDNRVWWWGGGGVASGWCTGYTEHKT